jgi:nitrogen fixation NifU-like protein
MNPQEKLLKDHYHNPKNYGILEYPNFVIQDYNPSCGDSITFHGLIEGNTFQKLNFTGHGCILSTAAASLLTELCFGKTVVSIASLNSDDILKLVGIPLGPLRIKCALLPLQALHKGIHNFIHDHSKK